jgi:hypothetical protein
MGNFKSELKRYEAVPRDLVFDNTMSDRARFVYVFMSCKPEGWNFFLEPMAAELGYSVDTLRKYINELISGGWLVKGEQKNVEHGKFGSVEYTLRANKMPTRKTTDTEKYRHGKNPTQDNTDYIENTDYLKENESDKSLSKESVSSVLFSDIDTDIQAKKAEEKRKSDELFEQCWIAYRRKGSKKKAKEYWLKIEEKQKQYVLPHINAYVSSRELVYQKDFERYLRDCTFNTLVYSGNNVIYDPTKLEGGEASKKYLPKSDIGFGWNDYYKCYMFSGFYTGFIPDGYSDDERPDGASVKLGNAQGTVIWSSEKKEWVLHREMV